MIDLFRPFVSPDAAAAVARVLTPDEHGRVYVGEGQLVKDFERSFGTLVDAPYPPLAMSSCTAALEMALYLCDVRGKEVITTPMTCTATSAAIVRSGAKIVWADVDPITGLISPESVAWGGGLSKDTAAIVAVDWGGRACDYDALRQINFNGRGTIPIIEDAAHALLTHRDGVSISRSGGDFVCWSFGPIKHLTCGGHGGALLSPHSSMERGRLLRWYGLDRNSKADFRCVHPLTKIRMKNGRAIPIATLVAEKNSGPVLVYENGQIVPRKVIGWHANPRAGRKFYRIAIASLEGREAATVTGDHLIMTGDGWKRADELTDLDEVATAYPSPSAIQRQLLIGGLLGDSGLNGHRAGLHRNTITETHTARDKSYAEAKVAAFSGLGMQIIERPADVKHPNGSVQFWSKSLPTLSDLGQSFYPEGRKIVPRLLIESEGLSDAALAIWFMDDGSTTIHNGRDALHPYCQIATNGFSESDVHWLAEHLCGDGLPCSVKSSAGTTGWRIHFTKDGSQQLVERIARFVPPTMRYKVGHLTTLDPFDSDSWGSGESCISWERVTVTERTEKKWNDHTTVYCLTVEGGSNSFVAGPIVVHNCEQDVTEPGWKAHLTDVDAAIGLANIAHATKIVARHRANAAFYCVALEGVDGVTVPPFDPGSAYWIFDLLVNDRESFQRYLGERGIMTSRVHRRNDEHPGYHYPSGPLPGVDAFDSRHVCIPVGWFVTDSEREQIADAVIAWAKTHVKVTA